MDWSVILPCFNEETRVGATLDLLCAHLREKPGRFEVVVVDDGSRDGTAGAVRAAGHAEVRLVRWEKNRGKGAALRRGVEEARGAFVFFADADLPYSLQFMDRALEILESGQAQVVVGARDLPGSQLDPSYPRLRVWMGRVYSRIVNALLPVDIFDTQCGFKAFSSAVLKKAVMFTTEDGYALDIELLLVLRLWSIPIRRLPVSLVRHHGSKIRVLRDSVGLLGAVASIRRLHRKGLYPSEAPPALLESVQCPACGSSEFGVFALIEECRFCRCSNCRTLYQNPRQAEEALQRLYGADYYSSSSIQSGYTEYFENLDLQRDTAHRCWERLERVAGRDLSAVLDVGCGSGEFLEAGRRPGRELWGNDLFQHRENSELRLVWGDFAQVDLPARHFALIVFNDSFEHFARPQPVLERCRQLVKLPGHLVINAPDPDSWIARLSGRRWISLKKEHLALYPRRVLAHLLQNSGFRPCARFASWQRVTWAYLEPRLGRFSAAARLAGWLLRKGKSAPLWVPTGGSTVVASARSLSENTSSTRAGGPGAPTRE